MMASSAFLKAASVNCSEEPIGVCILNINMLWSWAGTNSFLITLANWMEPAKNKTETKITLQRQLRQKAREDSYLPLSHSVRASILRPIQVLCPTSRNWE